MSDVTIEIVEAAVSVTEDVTDVVIVEDVTDVVTIDVGISGPSGVVSVSAPLTNNGTASSAVLGLNQSALSIAPTQVTGTAVTMTDLLLSMFGYPPSGYDVYPRHTLSSSSQLSNGTVHYSLFTPIKTVTVSTVTTQLAAGRLDYGYAANYRGVAIYQCSGNNNTTMTPLAVTWDRDFALWGTSNHGPSVGPLTGVSGTASTANGWTWVTCTATGAGFASGQKVTITGTAGSPGFTSFTGIVVGSPSTTSFIVQTAGTSVVTGTISAATVTGRPLTPSTCIVTGGSVVSGTGTVATVNVTCNSMPNEYTAGQWVNVTGLGLSISGVVSASPAPTSTSFTLTCPSTLTSGSIGTGTATFPDSYGRYVRPLFEPTSNGVGLVTPKSVTLQAGTTYAVGVMSNQAGGTTNTPSISIGGASSANQLLTPHLALATSGLSTITSAPVTASPTSGLMPWARLT